jgi:hypothetical protein
VNPLIASQKLKHRVTRAAGFIFTKFKQTSQVFLNCIRLPTTTYTPMPPKQRRAAAGGGQQPQKPTAKQELREQEQEADPSPPDATSETKTPGSKLRSEFERVMEELKCSCPTVIKLVGDPQGNATGWPDVEPQSFSHDRRTHPAVAGRCQKTRERIVEALGLAGH